MSRSTGNESVVCQTNEVGLWRFSDVRLTLSNFWRSADNGHPRAIRLSVYEFTAYLKLHTPDV